MCSMSASSFQLDGFNDFFINAKALDVMDSWIYDTIT